MKATHVTVVGAGAVGAASALYLRRAGLEVTLIERGEAGGGCSFGNAGLLSVSGVVPVAMPGILWSVPRLLADPLAPLAIRWAYLPQIAPWLLRFVRASAPARVEAISIALASLLAHGHDCWRALLDDDFASLTRDGGNLYVYESDAAYEGSQRNWELRRRRGVELRHLPQEQIRQLEPTLSPNVRHAVHITGTRFVLDPQRMVQALVARFAQEGGEVLQADATRLEVERDGAIAAETSAGRRRLDRVVIAGGAWSRKLARDCGVDVPLDTERGYHAMLASPGVMPRLPIMSGDHDFAITPMAQGLRLAGTVELGGLAAAPNWERAKLLLRQSETLLPGLKTEQPSFWMGFRPSLPDSLPVIGPAPGSDRVFLAFGHGHLGLTLGGITGRLIADLVAGRKPLVDPAPFSAARF